MGRNLWNALAISGDTPTTKSGMSSLDCFKGVTVSLSLYFTVASSGVVEVIWMIEEVLGSFWDNVGLTLKASFLTFFVYLCNSRDKMYPISVPFSVF